MLLLAATITLLFSAFLLQNRSIWLVDMAYAIKPVGAATLVVAEAGTPVDQEVPLYEKAL